MEKVCPRCGITHECAHDSDSQCHCVGNQLDSLQHAYLIDNYSGCLCKTCMGEMKDSFYISGVNPVYSKKK